MDKHPLERPLNYFGVFLLLLLLFIFMAYSFQGDTVDAVPVTDERYETNLSATGWEVIDISDSTGGVEPGSIVVFDPATGDTLDNPGNYTVLSYEEGRINLSRYYDADPTAHQVGVAFTEYAEDTSATRLVTPLLTLLELFVGFIAPIGIGIAAILSIGYLWRQMRGG